MKSYGIDKIGVRSSYLHSEIVYTRNIYIFTECHSYFSEVSYTLCMMSVITWKSDLKIPDKPLY